MAINLIQKGDKSAPPEPEKVGDWNPVIYTEKKIKFEPMVEPKADIKVAEAPKL